MKRPGVDHRFRGMVTWVRPKPLLELLGTLTLHTPVEHFALFPVFKLRYQLQMMGRLGSVPSLSL